MKALVKTLVGDVWNVSVVATIVLGAVALVYSGRTEVVAFVIPPLTLAGVAWLARRQD
ncbi:MAG: hypothetical protein ABSE20_01380 [Acetobacteraceae bacterium]